jgi:uncharacterized protein
MLDAGFITAALAGLVGGAHCIAMCGGYVIAARHTAQPLVPARRLRAGALASQLGRLVTYLSLGAAFGAAGGAAFAFAWPSTQRALYVAANAVLLITAARVAHPAPAAALLERAGAALFQRVAPLASRWLRGTHRPARVRLGLLWGLTPCALIYGVLPVALLAGSAWRGGLVMLGLWLGTLPALILAGGVAQRWATPSNRRIAAAVIALFAVTGLIRAIVLPTSLSSGPFCLIP